MIATTNRFKCARAASALAVTLICLAASLHAAELPRGSQYIGEYGDAGGVLYVLERDGKLEALIKRTSRFPLTVISDTELAFPAGGFMDGVKLHFSDKGVEMNGVFLPRIEVAAPGTTFKLTPIHPIDELRAAAARATPPPQPPNLRKPDLVELVKLDPTIKLDIRYAGTNNFMGTPFYTQARAFLQRPAAEAVVRAHHALKAEGYGLLIHDGYRPWSVTKMFWDGTPDDKHIFVADPSSGSKHNRGCAVDLSLYDLETGKPANMPSVYDEMSERAYPDYPGGTTEQRRLRDVLRSAMEAQGFQVYEFEWWHFDYQDWKEYPVLNIPFEKLASARSSSKK